MGEGGGPLDEISKNADRDGMVPITFTEFELENGTKVTFDDEEGFQTNLLELCSGYDCQNDDGTLSQGQLAAHNTDASVVRQQEAVFRLLRKRNRAGCNQNQRLRVVFRPLPKKLLCEAGKPRIG